MAVFQPWMVPEVNQGFWAALARGEFLTDAAAMVGTHRWRGLKVGARGRRGATAPRSRPEGPVCDLRRARGDRAGACRGRVDALDRASAGTLAIDDLAGSWLATPIIAAATARRPRMRWPTSARAAPSRPSCTSTGSCVRSLSRTFSTGTLPSRLEFPRFRGHLTAERFARSGRMSVDAEDPVSVQLVGLRPSVLVRRAAGWGLSGLRRRARR